MGACLVSPVEARKREWAEEIESAVKKLFEDHALLPEVLVKDPAFVSALIKATAVALATHRAEKRAMLRNLIVRIGARAIPDEELQHALLRLLEDLSAGHIEVLRFLKAHEAAVTSAESLEDIFAIYRTRYHGALGRMAFRWTVADLEARVVIHLGDLEDMSEFASQRSGIALEGSRIRPLQITELGFRFWDLVQEDAAGRVP